MAEYYIMPNYVVEKREKQFKWVVGSSLFYLLICGLISVPFAALELFVFDIALGGIYFFTELLRYICQKSKRFNKKKSYLIYQAVHVICLAAAAYVWIKSGFKLTELYIISDFFETVQLSEVLVGKWVLAILLIHKPANVLIQNLIGEYKPKEAKQNVFAEKSIGRFIGTLERGIMLLLVFINQYSAIGLVLTAKSIARYDRITKDEKFAEYYLLGTLLSTGIAVCCAVILL